MIHAQSATVLRVRKPAVRNVAFNFGRPVPQRHHTRSAPPSCVLPIHPRATGRSFMAQMGTAAVAYGRPTSKKLESKYTFVPRKRVIRSSVSTSERSYRITRRFKKQKTFEYVHRTLVVIYIYIYG